MFVTPQTQLKQKIKQTLFIELLTHVASLNTLKKEIITRLYRS